ncbi:hypothetical protein H4S07_001459 [Coemansia furcata]|uniref:Uncharacterized protein n=1 Tax=Coemansia furcata TaxID=417177 RepID=A0ACC1LP79_9FUNG|nr:hypothetical protein H4S07_001459 [Coemansia furcata]
MRRHTWASLVLGRLVAGRAPLVSLTVSVVGNITDIDAYQTTFDRSDYAYPLPQTGLSGFGFAGEVYVPESASCADEVVGAGVRHTPAGTGGIVFLPYRSCRDEWAQIVRVETQAGRAGGAILYSMKDDAAQSAERIPAPADLGLHAPVWVVNTVAGAYLASVLSRVNATGSLLLPPPPPAVAYGPVQDDVRIAVRAARGNEPITVPRAFVTISRSAADVASADRNFFLKAMIGVGITGIVCFFVAMVVRYFDCMRVTRRRRRSSDAMAVHLHHVHEVREKRVLMQHELDAMPCSVVALPVSPLVRSPGPLRHAQSCPHLPLPRTDDGLGLHRVSSVLHHCKPGQMAEEPSSAMNDNGWGENTLECAICLDEIHAGHVIRNLPCPHVFHAECIDRWLLCQSSTCPLCKRDTLYGPPV